jgi:hypothetical protein
MTELVVWLILVGMVVIAWGWVLGLATADPSNSKEQLDVEQREHRG